MYNNEDNNSTPYRASGNLNTSIGNPQMDINNTMNINIQSTNTVPKPVENNNNVNNNVPTSSVNNNEKQNNNINSQNIVSNSEEKKQEVPKININKSTTPNIAPNVNNKDNKPEDKKKEEPKPYVPNENTKTENKASVKLGSEFRFALLIVVLLLAFVLILPIISDLIGG